MKPTPLYLILAFLLLSGCASLNSSFAEFNARANERAELSRASVYNNSADKHMVNGVVQFTAEGAHWAAQPAVAEDGHQLVYFGAEKLVFKKQLLHKMNMADIHNAMAEYPYSYGAETDALARAYVATAKARGHSVIGYKPQATLALNKRIEQPFAGIRGSHAWLGHDVLLVEYNNALQPVSFLIRAHQAQASMGINVYMFTTVAFGAANMKWLLFNTNAHMLANNTYRHF